jgi:type IV secretion system protein TrbI
MKQRLDSHPVLITPDCNETLQESEAARTSHVFATTSARERPETAPALSATAINAASPASLPADQKLPLDPGALRNMQDRKLAFLNAPRIAAPFSSDRLQNPASSYVVQAGTVIPAALITDIQSDLQPPVKKVQRCFHDRGCPRP